MELGLKTPITEETIQSCKDYAAELRELLKECKKLDKYKFKSKATFIEDGFKDRLKNIFVRKPLNLKKISGASTSSGRKSTSSGRKSYARKSSSRTDPSVHMPCLSWENKERLADALSPILADLHTTLTLEIMKGLSDAICSDPVVYRTFLNYDDDRKKQFIENYLSKH